MQFADPSWNNASVAWTSLKMSGARFITATANITNNAALVFMRLNAFLLRA